MYADSWKSPYHFDEHWLDELDSEEKFYFLRFFAADGCNKSQYNNAVIGIQDGDLELLEKFKVLLKSDRPIRIEKNGVSKKKEQRFRAVFELTSKYFLLKINRVRFNESENIKNLFS